MGDNTTTTQQPAPHTRAHIAVNLQSPVIGEKAERIEDAIRDAIEEHTDTPANIHSWITGNDVSANKGGNQ